MCQSAEGVCSCSSDAITQTAGKRVILCKVSGDKYSGSGWTGTKEGLVEGLHIVLLVLFISSICRVGLYMYITACIHKCSLASV